MLSPNEARQQLSEVCQESDAARVSQLFTNRSLNAADAIKALGSLINRDLKLVRVLLENGADASAVPIHKTARSECGNELLWLFARYNYDLQSKGHMRLQDFAHDRETIDWLLGQEIDINRTDSHRRDDGSSLPLGETDEPPHLLNNAAARRHIDLFDRLVRRGADVSLSTALHSASRCEDTEKPRAMVCHLLDQHNMDIDLNNDDFRDLVHNAEDSGSPPSSAVLHRNLYIVLELPGMGAHPSEPYSAPVCNAVKAGGLVHAPPRALEQGEGRINAIARTAAYFERQPDEDVAKNERLEEEMETERNSKAILETLRSAMKTTCSLQ